SIFGPPEHFKKLSVWEPACNRGYMARPLAGFFGNVSASDIFDYSREGGPWRQDRVVDFLWPGSEGPKIAKNGVHWIITNPPFRVAEEFIERAWKVKGVQGLALLARTSFLEGVGRYQNIFSRKPPTIIAQFSERVPMLKGRLSATA